MSRESVSVFYNNPGWAVNVERERVPRTLYLKPDAACHAARALAKRMRCDLIVHDAHGAVVEHSKYGVSHL
jgi:hypothetical protein